MTTARSWFKQGNRKALNKNHLANTTNLLTISTLSLISIYFLGLTLLLSFMMSNFNFLNKTKEDDAVKNH